MISITTPSGFITSKLSEDLDQLFKYDFKGFFNLCESLKDPNKYENFITDYILKNEGHVKDFALFILFLSSLNQDNLKLQSYMKPILEKMDPSFYDLFSYCLVNEGSLDELTGVLILNNKEKLSTLIIDRIIQENNSELIPFIKFWLSSFDRQSQLFLTPTPLGFRLLLNTFQDHIEEVIPLLEQDFLKKVIPALPLETFLTLLSKHPPVMQAFWIDACMKPLPNETEKSHFFIEIIYAINVEELEEITEELIKLNSSALLYLLVEMSEEQFEKFNEFESPLINRFMLALSRFDNSEILFTLNRLLENQTRVECLLHLLKYDLNAERLFKYDPTLKKILKLVQRALIHQTEEESLIDNYSNQINIIPPFLIALCTRLQRWQSLITSMSPFFNDAIMKLAALAAPSSVILSMHNELRLKGALKNFKILYGHVTPSNLSILTEKNKEEFKKLESELSIHCKEFKSCKGNCDPLIEKILGLVNLFSSPFVRTICGSNKLIFSSYEIMLAQVKNEFLGPDGLFNKYYALNGKEEVIDNPFQNFSPIFQSLLTNGLSKRLNIKNIGVILEKGIKSDADLEKLKIYAEKIRHLSNFFTAIFPEKKLDSAFSAYVYEPNPANFASLKAQTLPLSKEDWEKMGAYLHNTPRITHRERLLFNNLEEKIDKVLDYLLIQNFEYKLRCFLSK